MYDTARWVALSSGSGYGKHLPKAAARHIRTGVPRVLFAVLMQAISTVVSRD